VLAREASCIAAQMRGGVAGMSIWAMPCARQSASATRGSAREQRPWNLNA